MSDRFYAYSKGRNRGFRKGKSALPRVLNIVKEQTCEVDPTQSVTSDSASVVSPAISLAISPSNGREQLTTETVGNKPSNQSGGHSEPLKPNCYSCAYRREIPGHAHSGCAHPGASPVALLAFMSGKAQVALNEITVRASVHGVRNGWFMWPVNFDPCWLQSCNGFTEASS